MISRFTLISLTEIKGESRFLSPSPTLEYTGTIWVLAPLTGLLLLHPDGSICSIQDHFALSLFGYTKDELLKKVSRGVPRHCPNLKPFSF